MPLVWAGVAIAGVLGVGWAAKETGEAMNATAKVAKLAAIGGAVYLTYSAAKSAGVLK